jgi:hypothetical protein
MNSNIHPKGGFSSAIAQGSRRLADITSKVMGTEQDVPQTVPKEQYTLAVSIIKAVGKCCNCL